jgi:peroxiredoxin
VRTVPSRSSDARIHLPQVQGRGVVFVGIDLQNDTWADSRAFLREFQITYPVGRDDTGAVGRAYRVTAIPTTYLVGPDGRILTVAITGGFTGRDGVHDLVAQLEKWLAAYPLPASGSPRVPYGGGAAVGTGHE